jgi:hypothetical protein
MLTVKELITLLQKRDPEAIVMAMGYDMNGNDGHHFRLDGFIEAGHKMMDSQGFLWNAISGIHDATKVPVVILS